jgi:hypothetical protein
MRCRAAMGLSCIEFARAVGVHHDTLLRWESDGMCERVNSRASSILLRWLLVQDDVMLATLGSLVREELGSREPDYVTFALFARAGKAIRLHRGADAVASESARRAEREGRTG